MVRVSDLEFSDSGMKKYLLFYSSQQFFSWLATIFLIGAVIASVFLLILDKPVPAGPLFIGMVSALPSVYFARQARFRIEGPWRVQACSAIEGRLEGLGFNKEIVNNKEATYTQKMPKFLRWEKSYINVKNQDAFVVITGPYGTLLGLRKFLTTNFS